MSHRRRSRSPFPTAWWKTPRRRKRTEQTPTAFFLFCDLPVGQGGLKHIDHLYSEKCTVQLMVYILNKIHKEVALDCATVEKLVLYKITSVVFCAIDAPLQVGNILNWHR